MSVTVGEHLGHQDMGAGQVLGGATALAQAAMWHLHNHSCGSHTDAAADPATDSATDSATDTATCSVTGSATDSATPSATGTSGSQTLAWIAEHNLVHSVKVFV